MSHTAAHQLDDELWQSILCQLTLVDTLNFSRTCKRFWSVAQEDAVWHCLYSTEFGACPPLQQNKRWKTIFKRRCGLPVTLARVLEHLFDIRKSFLNSSMQYQGTGGSSTPSQEEAGPHPALTKSSPGNSNPGLETRGVHMTQHL